VNAGFAPAHRYEPRTVAPLGIDEHAGWRTKCYAITCAGVSFEPDRFAAPIALARAALPVSAQSGSRPGVGFRIAHQGRGADYLIACWWDRDNELPMRIWVSAPGRDTGLWSTARDAESVCVWDLGVIWFERQAYVRTMIGGAPPDPLAYLAAMAPPAV